MWRIILSSFGAVFLAELGDKTQLATLLLTAETKSPWPVFIGSATALVLTSLIGVLAGEAISRVLPPHLLQTGAAIAFILIGVLLLFGKV